MSACASFPKTVPDSLLTCDWPPIYTPADAATQADAGDALTKTFLAGDSCADNLSRVRRLLKEEI